MIVSKLELFVNSGLFRYEWCGYRSVGKIMVISNSICKIIILNFGFNFDFILRRFIWSSHLDIDSLNFKILLTQKYDFVI